MLILLVDEADNAFAYVYSAAVSTQSIFRKIKQLYLIIGFTALSTVLAMTISIANYETFILLIGAVFVPLFGVVLSDYYIVKRRRYTESIMYSATNGAASKIGFPAIIAWSIGVLLYYLLSSSSPIYIPNWPPIGATIPRLGVSVNYAVTKLKSQSDEGNYSYYISLCIPNFERWTINN